MDFRLNTQLAEAYHSPTQKARVVTEDWVGRNLYCPICGRPVLRHYEANRPVADFFCEDCRNDFELKSKDNVSGAIGNTIADGAYSTMIERITSMQNPNFLFLTHHDAVVRNVILIPNHFFVPQIIVKRKPLAETARRAGWVGCNVDLTGIPSSGKIYIVRDGKEESKDHVISQYHRTRFLQKGNLEARGWTLDVLMCVERIPQQDFTLNQAYTFETELSAKHPDNNNVRAKIRQQLQVLRDQGYIEFTGRGQYRKL